MTFLDTRDGLIAKRAIVRLKPLCVDNGVTIYRVDYTHGDEPHTTTATDDAVETFLSAQDT
jgi:hypothetical protein